jgi:DNA-binding NarL/FixJ family response regulator
MQAASPVVQPLPRRAQHVRVLDGSELASLEGPRDWRAVVVVADLGGARDALDRGAEGIVLGDDDEALAASVEAVARGQVVIPWALHESLRKPALSARERQVLSLIVLGCSNREIARRLHVAETTVKTHVKSAFRKLGVRSRAEACSRILDPANGLGIGILGLTPAGRG